MKFLKKNFKMIIPFILGAILATGLTAYATYSYFADGVGYTRQGSNVENVEQALNELYGIVRTNNTKTRIIDNNSNALVLYNGCEVRKDEEDDYYLYFDGVDDYTQLTCNFPATVDWENGFTIECETKWDTLKWWSKIFDFASGNNNNNIFVGICGTAENFTISSRVGSAYYFESSAAVNTSLLEKAKFKIVVEKISNNNYKFSYYRNDVFVGEKTLSGSFANANRTYNYLGKPNFTSNNDMFNGRIYSLKIDQANGTNIIDIDVNAMYK